MTTTTRKYGGFHTIILLMALLASQVTTAAPEDWLKDEQIRLLNNARNTDYSVTLLSGTVNDRERHVVLLGEFHVKRRRADEVGRELLEHFPMRGLESIQTDEGTLTKALTAPAVLTIHAIQRILGTLTSRSYSSSILAAQEETHTEGSTEVYLESGSNPLVTTVAVNAVFASLALPLVITAANRLILAHQYHPTLFKFLSGYLASQNILLVGTAALDIINYSAIAENLRHSLSLFFPVPYYLVDYRNEIMAGNIVRAFEEYPEHDTMLVITGMAHSGGLALLLERDYSFYSETLPRTGPPRE